MSAVAVDEAHRVVEIQVAEIAPHPFNDNAARSRSQATRNGTNCSTEYAPTAYDCRCSSCLAMRS